MSSAKKIFILLLVFLSSSFYIHAQVPYQVSQDSENVHVKILKGIITKADIVNDTSFNWYNPSYVNYGPDSSIVNSFKKAKDSLQFILFGGTWCEDTQFILPKFFKLQELSGISESQVTLFGVDHAKRTLGNIAAAFHITNVPTIIVMRHGKELGRVIEYGKTGKWDKELADIISSK